MSLPHRPATRPESGADTGAPSASTTWTVRRRPAVPRPSVPTRRYEVAWLTADGEVDTFTRVAPALAVFEEAFSAFARGTLIATSRGPVAVEDLWPGDMIETIEGEHLPLRWKGALTLLPGIVKPDGAEERLFRLPSDSFGLGRPAPDLLLGPNARYLMRSDQLKSYLGAPQALTPIACMADGMNVLEVTPISPVPCYHIALDGHRVIRANGVEVESFHPGANSTSRLMGDLRGQFLGLFPHIAEMADFGPMCHPRLTAGDLEQMNAA